MIPDYMLKQILEAKPPEGCCVPEGALPALAEGHLEIARVATIGINPHGGPHTNEWLREKYSPLDKGGAERLWEHKTTYFEYKKYRYFSSLERILKKCGFSYGGQYDHEDHYSDCFACSLDIAQWPTNPRWGQVPKTAQEELLRDGAPFLRKILEKNPRVKLMLGNGSSVVEGLEKAFGVRFNKTKPIKGLWRYDVQMYDSALLGRRFIGWSVNLQSSPGVSNELRDEVAKRVGELVSGICCA